PFKCIAALRSSNCQRQALPAQGRGGERLPSCRVGPQDGGFAGDLVIAIDPIRSMLEAIRVFGFSAAGQRSEQQDEPQYSFFHGWSGLDQSLARKSSSTFLNSVALAGCLASSWS